MAQQSPAAKNCSHAKSDGWSSFLGPLKSHVWHYKLVHRETFMASRARSLAWIFFITFSSSTISSLLVVSLDLQIYGRHFNPTQHLKKNQDKFQFLFHTVLGREDKTIESAVPFPAPEKGDNRGLSPFHPRMIIVVGECPLLSPVWKSSPLPRKPLKCLENLPPSPSPVTGAGTGKGTPSFNVPFRPLYSNCNTDMKLRALYKGPFKL